MSTPVTTAKTVRIRPGTLNVEMPEGRAWNVTLTILRNGAAVDLRNAVVRVLFRADQGAEVTLAHTPVDLEHGKIAIGQSVPMRGKFVIEVAEDGAIPRPMVKGVFLPKALF